MSLAVRLELEVWLWDWLADCVALDVAAGVWVPLPLGVWVRVGLGEGLCELLLKVGLARMCPRANNGRSALRARLAPARSQCAHGPAETLVGLRRLIGAPGRAPFAPAPHARRKRDPTAASRRGRRRRIPSHASSTRRAFVAAGRGGR